ncbi:MAG: DUF935 family protein, partial [Tannerella sp.]|nr:DUF935 family protein [Tannerella sp.]
MATKAKKPAGKAGTVINQIIIKAPQRKTFDVGTWRNALRSADTGRPRELFDLFDDLLLDGYLWDACNKRTAAVTNSELVFQNEKGEQAPELTDLMDTAAFEELLTVILKARFWGRSGIELDYADGLTVNELPVKHINLDKKVILLNETDETGIPYEQDGQLIVLGRQRDYGVFIRTAPMVIWKRGGFGDYAQWLEIFGMPQRIGKYNSYDPESRRLMEEALKNAGAAPYVVIPDTTNVETVNNTGTGTSGQSYERFRTSCNEEILVTVLGQTLTTIQGERGARSLGEVHKQVEEGINMSDMRYVQRILNARVRPFLETRGLPVAGGRFVFPGAAVPLSVADVVQLSSIMPVPASFLHEKYGIPVPKDGEPVAGAKRETAEVIDAVKNHDDPPVTSTFAKRLKGFFADALRPRGAVRNLTDRATGHITLAGDAENARVNTRIDFRKLFNKALQGIYAGRAKEPYIERSLFDITNNALQDGIGKTFAAAGMEFGKRNQAFVDEFKYNASVFAAFKNHAQTREIVALLHDEKGSLRSFSKFRKEALKVSQDYNVNWLQTEYNTAIRAARSAVNWKTFQQTKDLYPNLQYVKTSASHPRAKHLKWAEVPVILPVDHSWWDTHMPPSDWNCKCSVKQTDRPASAVPDGDTNPVFRNNPGKTAEFVNLKETSWIRDQCPHVGSCS